MTIAELERKYAQTIADMTVAGLCEAGEMPSLDALVQTIKDTVGDEQLRFDCFEKFFAWWDVTTAYDQMDDECTAEQHKPALAIAYEALVMEVFFSSSQAATESNASDAFFAEQIVAAVEQLGAKEAASRMARALIVLAHTAGSDMEFSCDQGDLVVTRKTIPESAKN